MRNKIIGNFISLIYYIYSCLESIVDTICSFLFADWKLSLEQRIAKAISCSDHKSLYQLTSYDFDPNAVVHDRNGETETLLIAAIYSKNEKAVSLLINEGADPNMPIPHGKSLGETPIIAAVYVEAISLAQILINNGADINAERADGTTALRIAILFQSIKLIEFLIANGADVNYRLQYGCCKDYTPLMIANQRKGGDGSIIKLLINSGANTEDKLIDPYFPNRQATVLDKSLIYENPQTIKALIENGANTKVLIKGKYLGNMCAETAMKINAPEIVAALIDNNGIHAKIKNASSPFIISVFVKWAIEIFYPSTSGLPVRLQNNLNNLNEDLRYSIARNFLPDEMHIHKHFKVSWKSAKQIAEDVIKHIFPPSASMLKNHNAISDPWALKYQAMRDEAQNSIAKKYLHQLSVIMFGMVSKDIQFFFEGEKAIVFKNEFMPAFNAAVQKDGLDSFTLARRQAIYDKAKKNNTGNNFKVLFD